MWKCRENIGISIWRRLENKAEDEYTSRATSCLVFLFDKNIWLGKPYLSSSAKISMQHYATTWQLFLDRYLSNNQLKNLPRGVFDKNAQLDKL